MRLLVNTHSKSRQQFKPLIFFLIFLIILPACTIGRNIAFPPIGDLKSIENATTVAIIDFDLKMEIDNSEYPETYSDDTYSVMRKRLEEQLMVNNLKTISKGEAEYDLTVKVKLEEHHDYNGYFGPALVTGICLFPLGVLIMPSFPYNDIFDKVIADVSLIEHGSNKILYSNKFEKKEKIRLSGYQVGNPTKANSKLNLTFANIADDVFIQISNEVSKILATIACTKQP